MKLKSPTTLAALVLIGVGGFMAGRVSSPAAAADAQDGPPETRATRSSSRNASAEDAARKISRTSKGERGEKPTAKDRLDKLEAIVRGENPLERNRALLAFLDQLGPGDFEDAVSHFRSLGITDSRNGEYALLLTAWAQADPLSALTYAKENTNGGFAQDTILTSWATTDPEAAVHWAQTNYDGEGPNPYLPGIIRGLYQADPLRATELLAGMPRSEERGKGLDFILPHLLEQGSEATRSWISSITDEALRNGAMIRASEKLAESDPEGTASWLLANPGEASQRRMDDVYSAWAQKDQQAALASVTLLPAGQIRSDAFRGIVGTVAAENPNAALSLMNRYPGDVNDQVVQNFVWSSSGSDPATAASQIARIGDERQRDQMYRRMLGNWIQRDPASAQAWMQSNPLPDAVRERLNRSQERQP
ncbi:MAG: hypothetical protein V4584_11030 [Verrucomicrobiota bacterium]